MKQQLCNLQRHGRGCNEKPKVGLQLKFPRKVRLGIPTVQAWPHHWCLKFECPQISKLCSERQRLLYRKIRLRRLSSSKDLTDQGNHFQASQGARWWTLLRLRSWCTLVQCRTKFSRPWQLRSPRFALRSVWSWCLRGQATGRYCLSSWSTRTLPKCCHHLWRDLCSKRQVLKWPLTIQFGPGRCCFHHSSIQGFRWVGWLCSQEFVTLSEQWYRDHQSRCIQRWLCHLGQGWRGGGILVL